MATPSAQRSAGSDLGTSTSGIPNPRPQRPPQFPGWPCHARPKPGGAHLRRQGLPKLSQQVLVQGSRWLGCGPQAVHLRPGIWSGPRPHPHRQPGPILAEPACGRSLQVQGLRTRIEAWSQPVPGQMVPTSVDSSGKQAEGHRTALRRVSLLPGDLDQPNTPNLCAQRAVYGKQFTERSKWIFTVTLRPSV